MENSKVSIIIPTYNEAGNIRPLFEKIIESMANRDYEIIVIDDNSEDNTPEVVKRVSEELHIGNRVKLIVRKHERGLATAVLAGMKYADGRIFIVMDADLQHPPEKIPELISILSKSNYEVAIASRTTPEAYNSMAFYRKIMSFTAKLMAKMLLPNAKNISDPMSGFFAIKREVYERAKGKLSPKGYKILLEIIVKGNVDPAKIAEVPYVFGRRYSGRSKLGSKEIFNYIMHLLQLNEYRFLKFLAVGASGTLVNEAVLWLLHYALTYPIYISGIISIELSVINNFVLNSVFTFRNVKSASGIASRFIKYHASAFMGLLINYVTLLFLTIVVGVNALISNFIGIVLGFMVNYVLSERYVWKRNYN